MEIMRVNSGGIFHPLDPQFDEIHIEDIAHALSLMCRGNGQLRHFYSVAQHSINCAIEAKARGYSRRVQLACLLHDGSEAYIADIIRPIKPFLSNYYALEEKLQNLIYEKYLTSKLCDDEAALVKLIDDEILRYELHELLNGSKATELPNLSTIPLCEVVPFEVNECSFLTHFYELSKESQ